MIGHAADAEDEAGVLHAAVGIVQARADRADLRTLRLLEHGAEPVGVETCVSLLRKRR